MNALTLEQWLQVVAIIVLMLISGFFSGSETALTAASRARMFQLEKSKEKNAERATIVGVLIRAKERLIGALLLGNNMVNILASALATSLFLSIFGEAGVAIATIVMTLVVVIFAEVLPKTWAISNPDRFALAVAPLVRILVFTFGPVTGIIAYLVRWLLARFGVNILDDQSVLSATDELRGTLDLMHEEGTVVKTDRDRVGGVLDLHELEVADIMVHRTEMVSFDINTPAAELVPQILSSSFTRHPLYDGEIDNIVGILHAKSLFRALIEVGNDPEKVDFHSVAQAPWFVPDTTSLQTQLNQFLRRQSHLAIVVDEYGEVEGIVTLEDILEEIVGDISDEHDIDIKGVEPQPDGSLIVDGGVPIRDINRAMDWQLPDDEATTIAGLVIHEARAIPNQNQQFTFHGLRFLVLKKERNRIISLKLVPTEPAKAAKRA
ncbi:MAG: HlyC/CorC family transporter [Rhizobiales bacterium]|nr:HlyC/CorC family transporter [Hyphomicrobiales bacterium]